ncbi:MAG: SDR family NAD(P)-dependent oxidoreductase [Burkholderiaceae bacterium]|nr:SDR family NAD(P)-dependent oxidoreductase [Burkholderiaceae bacterium]
MALNPRLPLTEWQGRCVWLVGASSGIGRATASALHRAGAQVAVSARDARRLQQFVDEHPGALALPLDVGDAQALQAATAQLLQRHGRIDLAMYCAGHYRAMRATAFDLGDALRHQQVNYVGALQLLDAVLPALLRQAAAGLPAHLSLVASVAGYRGLPNALAYGPTKAALINLAEVLYLDLAAQGIGVSLVNPGFVETPLTAQNEFHMPALITPDAAAAAILRGWAAGSFEIHFPKRFTRLLKALRPFPDALYFGAVRRATGHG